MEKKQNQEQLDPDVEMVLERILASIAEYCTDSGMTKEETLAVITNEQVRNALMERSTMYLPINEESMVVVTSVRYDELQCSETPSGLLS